MVCRMPSHHQAHQPGTAMGGRWLEFPSTLPAPPGVLLVCKGVSAGEGAGASSTHAASAAAMAFGSAAAAAGPRQASTGLLPTDAPWRTVGPLRLPEGESAGRRLVEM